MNNIRTAQQVDEIYQRLYRKGKANDPYVLEYEASGRLLIFFGARHSNDPADVQWPIYSLSDPSQSKASEASGEFRDITLLGAMTTHWQQKKDIFVIYGSGHAIALEPALREPVKLDND